MALIDDLRAAGFTPGNAIIQGDFLLQDDSDGRGAYIREWRSALPCPFPAQIRAPVPPPAPEPNEPT